GVGLAGVGLCLGVVGLWLDVVGLGLGLRVGLWLGVVGRGLGLGGRVSGWLGLGLRLVLAATLGAGEYGLRRREQHRHIAPVLDRPLLDDGEVSELLGEALEQRRPTLGMRHLAPAEHDRDLDLVLVAQEAGHVTLLRVVVVLRDLRAELDLPDRDLLLMLARGLGLLG